MRILTLAAVNDYHLELTATNYGESFMFSIPLVLSAMSPSRWDAIMRSRNNYFRLGISQDTTDLPYDTVPPLPHV